MANIAAIISELKAERDRLDNAISALEGINSNGRSRVGRPRKRRKMSAAARARISAGMRRRWAAWKKAKKSAA